METKNLYRVWSDNDDFDEIISAFSIEDALDTAASKLGYSDYIDMAQELGWNTDEDDGLNIRVEGAW